MIEILEEIEYYLYLKNGNVIKSNLPDGVSFKNDQLLFQNKMPITFELIIELDSDDYNLECKIDNHTKVELIEIRKINSSSHYTRKLSVLNDASLAVLVLDETSQDYIIEEKNIIFDNAIVESAYAQLSLGNMQGKYNYDLDGQGATVNVRIAALSTNHSNKNIEIAFHHLKPNTYGKMNNYGVVKEGSYLCFDGVGRIEKGNSQSQTHQVSKIMIFDQDCIAKANPYLFIDEYDVKASHAAGVGKYDEEHLFYLQSRGLTKDQAMQLVTYGYFMPVVEVIHNQTIKETFIKILERRMGD